MTDLRARLADALWERLPKSEVLGPIYVKEMADVLTDVALSLPGIAIVDTENVDRSAQALAKAIWEGLDAWDLLSEGERGNYRRWVKAALLAAADTAEEKHD